MKKILAVIMIMLLAFTMLTGCGDGGNVTDDNTVYTMKFAHVSPTSNDKNPDTVEWFAEYIDELTDGRIKIEHYPASTLGNEQEILEGLQMGTIELAVLSASPIGSYNASVLATTMPYLFTSREAAYDFFDGEAGDWLKEQVYDATGVIVADWGENGLRCFSNSKHTISEPKDLKGLKFRTQDNPMTMATVEALGGSYQSIAFGELYTALSQGTVDGQENPLGLIQSNSLYEVNPYITVDQHVYEFAAWMISEQALNKLPEDLQEILMNALSEIGDKQRELSIYYDDYAIEQMEKEGVEITYLTDEQLQMFKDATSGVQEIAREKYGDEVVDKILKYADEANAAHKN